MAEPAEGTAPPPLLIERTPDDLVILTINRRGAVNSVSFELWVDFGAAPDEIEFGTPPRGVIVTGAGGFLSIGAGNRQATGLAKRLLHDAQESGLEGSHAPELAYGAICQSGAEVVRAREAFVRKAAERRSAKA